MSDCRPYARFSDDETRTWSEPIACIPEEDGGYYVLNNDRVVQLKSGRIILPVANTMRLTGTSGHRTVSHCVTSPTMRERRGGGVLRNWTAVNRTDRA